MLDFCIRTRNNDYRVNSNKKVLSLCSFWFVWYIVIMSLRDFLPVISIPRIEQIPHIVLNFKYTTGVFVKISGYVISFYISAL